MSADESEKVAAAREAIEAAADEIKDPTIAKLVGTAFQQRGDRHRLDTYARLAREYLAEHDDRDDRDDRAAEYDDTPRRGGVA